MFASDNECYVNQNKGLSDFDSRISFTELHAPSAGESQAPHASHTPLCRNCGGEIQSGDRRHKHCSERCALQSKRQHRNARQSAYRAAHPERERAKLTLGRAIRSGEIRRVSRCEECGARTFTEGHHTDYSRPLYVTWVCRPCHAALEGGRHFGAGQRKDRPRGAVAAIGASGAAASQSVRPASAIPSQSSALSLAKGVSRA